MPRVKDAIRPMVGKTQVPDGWEKTTLRDQLDLCRNGIVCRQDADPAEALPVTRIETISEGKINWDRVGHVSPKDANPQYLLQRGDILLSHINSIKHIAKVARKTDDRPLIHGMNLMVLRCGEHMDPGFGFAIMSSHQTKMYMESRAKKAVNQASINTQDIYALPILLPPLPEQRAIAAVLDSIDEAIERTEAVIAATEQLRDALLHELLTRGVPGWHSEWKEAPGIGTIPASWEVVRLGDVLRLEYGVSLPERERLPGDVPVVGSAGIVGRHKHATNTGPGVIVGRKGSIGTVTWMPNDFVPIDTTYFAVPTDAQVDLLWMYHLLAHDDLSKLNRATGVPGLNRDDVYALKRRIPPLPEQQAIAAMLDGVDEAIDRAREERDGLQWLKASTSDALLTGRVRMKVRNYNE